MSNAFGPGDHPGGKHVLKMASSPDSVEERRRLQGRVRTQTASSPTAGSSPNQCHHISSLCTETESVCNQAPSDSEVETDPSSPLTQEVASSPPPLPRKRKRMETYPSTFGLAEWELQNTLFRITEKMPVPKYRLRILSDYFREHGLMPPPMKRQRGDSGYNKESSPLSGRNSSLTPASANAPHSPELFEKASPKITRYFAPSAPATPNRRHRPKRFALYNFDEDWCRDTKEPVPSINIDYPPSVEDHIDYDTLIKARKEEFNSIFIFNC